MVFMCVVFVYLTLSFAEEQIYNLVATAETTFFPLYSLPDLGLWWRTNLETSHCQEIEHICSVPYSAVHSAEQYILVRQIARSSSYLAP